MRLINFLSIMYSKALRKIGIRHSTTPIPEGHYCYLPDETKNAMKTLVDEGTYYIVPCIYYRTLGKRYNGCKYLGRITDDFLFGDQCKLCGENYGDIDNE